MKFNGAVGDLGSAPKSYSFYDICYVGSELGALKEFVEKRCREKGVEVMSITKDREGKDKWKVTARVRSEKGIV